MSSEQLAVSSEVVVSKRNVLFHERITNNILTAHYSLFTSNFLEVSL
ncbi:hypothetical protein R84B8_00246 [Treponema sp. R8-4-B8]